MLFLKFNFFHHEILHTLKSLERYSLRKLFIQILLLLSPSVCFGFEIFALGTSNTNCKDANQAFTNTLNELLAQDGLPGTVINAGVDGDRPVFMVERLKQGLVKYPNIKLVLFEPGPNEKNPRFNLGPSAEILSYLQDSKIPTIFMSNRSIQPDDDEAKQFSEKYGAYYYGHWARNTPGDSEYWSNKHMTEKGCRLWANNLLPLIKQVIKERNIH
jgi:hypothetical protein